MVISSDYEELVAHYRELMDAYEEGSPGRSAYEYVISMLSPFNGRDKEIQRDSILVLMHCIESLLSFAFQTEENQPEQQINNAIYTEVLKSLKRFLASGDLMPGGQSHAICNLRA